MRGTEPGSAREEAERLVAAALAAARLAAAGRREVSDALTPLGHALAPLGEAFADFLEPFEESKPTRSRPGRTDPGKPGPTKPGPTNAGPVPSAGKSTTPGTSAAADDPTGAQSAAGGTHHAYATGSAECCACPVCKGIAALRDPSPEFAERLAAGAGDLAAGVASLLRAFDTMRGPGRTSAPRPDPAPGEADQPSGRSSPDDGVWRAATQDGHDSDPATAGASDVWSAATHADSTTGAGVDGSGATPAEPAGGPTSRKPAPAQRQPSGEHGADSGDEA